MEVATGCALLVCRGPLPDDTDLPLARTVLTHELGVAAMERDPRHLGEAIFSLVKVHAARSTFRPRHFTALQRELRVLLLELAQRSETRAVCRRTAALLIFVLLVGDDGQDIGGPQRGNLSHLVLCGHPGCPAAAEAVHDAVGLFRGCYRDGELVTQRQNMSDTAS